MAAMRPAITRPVVSPQTLSFSGTARSAQQANLLRALTGDILVEGSVTVTDASISAGELLDGAIQRLLIGSENRPLAIAQRDETFSLIDYLKKGVSTGFNDGIQALPVTATAYSFVARLRGPWDFSRYKQPILYVDIDPLAEWASATGFLLTARVIQMPFNGGVTRRVWRAARAAAASHKIGLGPGVVNSVYVRIGADSALNEAYLTDAQGNYLVSIATAARINALVAAWAGYKEAAFDTTPNQYLIQGLGVPYFSNRELQLELGSSQTALAFAGGPDP